MVTGGGKSVHTDLSCPPNGHLKLEERYLSLLHDVVDGSPQVLEIVPSELAVLINDAIDVVRPASNAKNIQLHIDLDPGTTWRSCIWPPPPSLSNRLMVRRTVHWDRLVERMMPLISVP